MSAKKGDDLAELGRLGRYLEILVNEYPNPVTHKDLASKAGVTKAAITKVKERLYRICEVRELIYRRKLVLKNDQDTITKLATIFFFDSKINRFLKSRYGRDLIKKMNIHKKMSEAFPDYSRYFAEADTNFIIETGLNISDAFSEIGKIRSKVTDPEELQYITSMKVGKALQKAFDSLPFHLKDENDLKRVLSIREKSFFLIRDLLNKKVVQLDILETLQDDSQRQLYLDVYVHTIDYYLRRLFDSITDSIRQIAVKAGIRYKEDYFEIGKVVAELDATRRGMK